MANEKQNDYLGINGSAIGWISGAFIHEDGSLWTEEGMLERGLSFALIDYVLAASNVTELALIKAYGEEL
jgi:hypothetical protein